MSEPAVVAAAEPEKKSGLQASFRVHDSVRVDRVGGDRDVGDPGRCLQPECGWASRFRGRITRWRRSRRRSCVDSLTAPINGLYGIEDAKGNINYYNSGSLFGAIDIALFILVIGGFLGVTMKTGAIQAGIGSLVQRMQGRERWMIPVLMSVFALGGTTLRDGRGEPGLLRARDHGDDRRRVRRAHGRGDRAARLRDRRARLDGQPVRDRDRLRDRRRPDQRGHRSDGW